MIWYLAVMSWENIMEIGGSSEKPMLIHLSTRRRIPRNSSHLVNKTVWDFQISIHLWRENMVKQRRALTVLRDGLEGCFHVAVCGTGLCYPRHFMCEKRISLIKSVVHPSVCAHGNRYHWMYFFMKFDIDDHWNFIENNHVRLKSSHDDLLALMILSS